MNNEELEFLYKKLEKYSNFAEDNNEERFLEIVDKITFYKLNFIDHEKKQNISCLRHVEWQRLIFIMHRFFRIME